MKKKPRQYVTALILENYRAFGARTRIPCAPITLLFGKNSVGKSAALSSLQFLQQSLNAPPGSPVLSPFHQGAIVDLGLPSRFFYKHDTSQRLTIGLAVAEWAPSAGDGGPAGVCNNGRNKEYEITWTFKCNPDRDYVFLDELHTTSSRGCSATFVPQGFARSDLNDVYLTFEIAKTKDSCQVTSDSLDAMAKELHDCPKFTAALERRYRRALERSDTSGRPPSGRLRRVRDCFCSEKCDTNALRKILLNEQRLAEVTIKGLSVMANSSRRSRKAVVAGICARIVDKLQSQAYQDGFPGLWAGRRQWPAAIDVAEEAEAAAYVATSIVNTLKIIGPKRALPSRFHGRTTSAVVGGDVGGEGEGLAGVLAHQPHRLVEVNNWLRRLEIPYELTYQPLFIKKATRPELDSFQPSDIGALQLHDLRRPGVTVGFSDVGYGLSQVMPVVCQLLLARDSLITIEQPELHIHPALQAELAELILYSAQVLGNQVIVETHSEHLALRMQRSVRAGTAFGPEMYSLVYIDAEDTGSTAQGLPLGPAGQLMSQPPGGWFPERLRELLPRKSES
jgi:hypothetical protein